MFLDDLGMPLVHGRELLRVEAAVDPPVAAYQRRGFEAWAEGEQGQGKAGEEQLCESPFPRFPRGFFDAEIDDEQMGGLGADLLQKCRHVAFEEGRPYFPLRIE